MRNTKVAWVTGAGRGIGRAVAVELAKNGYALGLSARSLPEIETVAEEIKRDGGEAMAVQCDVADAGSVQTAYATLSSSFLEPEVLVNNAGISPWSTFTETSTKEFDSTIAVNLRGMFLCSKIALPAMYKAGNGTIVQMLSVGAVRAYKNGAAYVASKYGALGFSNALREEARKHGVRVINVMPGAVETDLWDISERERSRSKMMQPVDIAMMISAALREPSRAMVEDIMIRPIGGDI
jgi:short-subunit dehydrogenase